MGTITYVIPTAGSTLNSIADPEVSTALQTLLTWANGNIDAVNISAVLAQAAGVNQGSQTVKGASNNAGPGTRTNTAYGALSDAADQVTGLVLPTNGLIVVWYQATWQESVNAAANAAIFVGANQTQIANLTGPTAGIAATVGDAGGTAINRPLFSTPQGLASLPNSANGYTGDVTTGQVIGGNGTTVGGPCYIFAAAGTYAVGVQFKATSGTVTASNRKLWVQALAFS